ncbi:MAG TPA: ABC transporter permease [Candidatus Alectryocaccomicrobium excrementavium]|uniref:ABC transporter permease n=1 Tax=Candidatus Alectryocaccomicrobium excrementavium TaxID=2840668 RepID=A0A9D1G218_9FIRM|nr:ABC transporter permease [Candidatus Alectryocaccomicrobium excrementavium]
MLKYFVKKLLMTIPMLLLLSFLVFGALEFSPTDPVSYMVSPDMASNVDMDAMRETLGLNRPFLVRYFDWLGNLLRGEFGYSLVQGVSISKLIGRYLPATFQLAIVVLALSTILAIGLGFLAAVKQNTKIDYICSVLGVVGISIPQFFLGLFLILVFALKLGWLPIGGRSASTFWGMVRNMVLPVMTMTISMTAALMRYTRNSMLDVLNKDYIKTARSKGIPEWKVYIKHAFRNSLTPILTLLCFRLPMLIGGSVVIESLFGWPGIGNLIVTAVSSSDYPLILITTLMTAAVTMFASLLVDLLTAILDPRVRLS